MKKHTTLAVLSILFSITAYAQKEIDFSVSYRPEMKYDQTIIQSTEMKISYSGPKEVMEKLKEKGMQNGVDHKQSSTIETICHTGAANDDHSFPMKIEFADVRSDNPGVSSLAGVTMSGHCTIDSLPSLDAITAPDMDPTVKKMMLQMMQGLYSQISYPKRQVKMGEKFSKESNISLPISGFNLDFRITTYYKLVKVEDGIARFDMTQEYTMLTKNLATMEFKAKGKGTGYLDYDIAHHFYTAYKLNTLMEMDMVIEKMNMKLKMETTSDQHSVITAEQ